jgi:hypothetical protein
MNTLDSKTNIPLFAIISVIPVLTGFIIWLSSVAFSASNAEKRIAELESKQETYNNLLVSIKEDLTLVKYKLDIKERTNGNVK